MHSLRTVMLLHQRGPFIHYSLRRSFVHRSYLKWIIIGSPTTRRRTYRILLLNRYTKPICARVRARVCLLRGNDVTISLILNLFLFFYYWTLGFYKITFTTPFNGINAALYLMPAIMFYVFFFHFHSILFPYLLPLLFPHILIS